MEDKELNVTPPSVMIQRVCLSSGLQQRALIVLGVCEGHDSVGAASGGAIVRMLLRSKRLPDHDQVRDPCWRSRCADTHPRPDALGIQANLPAQSAQAARRATLALLRSPRPLALSRARDQLPQAFTGEVLGAHLVVLQAPVGGDLLHQKMSHSDMTQFAVLQTSPP